MAASNINRAPGAAARATTDVTTFLLLAAVTAWAFVTGYYRMFSIFGGWDDEGYLMMTVKQFLAGDLLYKDIWTIYGPAYYLYKWIVHGLLALPNTHDVNKWTTLSMWVLISLLGGLLVLRLTRSSLGAAAAQALVFLTLFITAFVPTHPQELCAVLIVAALLAIPGDDQNRWFSLRLILTGALCSGVVLTKINIGVFFGLALALTLLAFTAASRLQKLLLFGLTAAALLLPFVLFRKHLRMHWFELGVITGAALLVAVAGLSLLKNERAVFKIKDYAIFAISFLAAAALICVFALGSNATPAFLLDGLVLAPLKFSGAATPEGLFYRVSMAWATFAFCAAAAIFFYGERRPRQTEIAISLLQLLFGLATCFSLLIGNYNIGLRAVQKFGGSEALIQWIYINESVGHFVILNFAAPFLWLLIVKQFRRTEFSADSVPRTALALAAIFLTWQIYPVPGGSHIAIATFSIVIAAIVCLCDAFRDLKTLLPRLFGQTQFYTALAAAAILVLIFFGAHRTHRTRAFYNNRYALDIAGAAQMRLSAEEVAAFNFVTYNLTHDCDSFVAMPNFFSFNFWANKETPTNFNVNAWTQFLDQAKQRAIIEKLKTSQTGCAVSNANWSQYWLIWFQDAPKQDASPLAAFIANNYTATGTAFGYQFMRQNGASKQLVYAARALPSNEPMQIEFVLPAGFDRSIHRAELFAVASNNSAADSRTEDFRISNEQGESIAFPLSPPTNAATAAKYKIRWSNLNPALLAQPENLILRLYDENNRIVAHLPFPTK